MEDLHGLFWQGSIENYFLGHQFEEIFKSRIYDPYLVGKVAPVIVDAGANIGVFTLYASRGAGQVYSIEPSQEHFDCLTHMIEFNKLTNVKAFKFALSAQDGKENLSHYTNKTMYSLYNGIANGPITGNLKLTGSEPVELKRLDTFFKEQKIEHVDLLKLDVEGVEFEITGSDSFANVAGKIDVVVGEIHAYSGRHPNQIGDAFRGNGFSFETISGDAVLFVAKRLK